MTGKEHQKHPILGVGAVVLRGTDILLIRRGKPPREGDWSLPGGRVELGEATEAAVLREVREETGLDVKLGPLIDVIDYIEPTPDSSTPAFHYVLIDYLAFYESGEPVAASDAMDALFFPASDVLKMPLWSQTLRVIKKALELAEDMKEQSP